MPHEKQNFFQRLSLGSPSSRSAHLPPAEAAVENAAVREDEAFAPGSGPHEAPRFSSERREPRGLGRSRETKLFPAEFPGIAELPLGTPASGASRYREGSGARG